MDVWSGNGQCVCFLPKAGGMGAPRTSEHNLVCGHEQPVARADGVAKTACVRYDPFRTLEPAPLNDWGLEVDMQSPMPIVIFRNMHPLVTVFPEALAEQNLKPNRMI